MTRRPPATLAYTSALVDFTLRVLLEDREQHREAPRLHPGRRPAWHRSTGAHDQRLHLDEQRPRAFEHRRDRRAGHAGTAVDEEPGRRVGHVDQAAFGHLEEPELVGAAEPVLQRVHRAQRVTAVAVEREHGVDDVLEHPRARRRCPPW